MRAAPPTSVRRALFAALAASTVAGALLTLFQGFSGDRLVRLAQAVAVFGLGAVIVGGAVALALVQLGGWRDPESDDEFEALVERSERLAASEPWTDEDAFQAIVRAALDELPLEFHQALEHVAIVVADGGAEALVRNGARHGAYGLYEGGTVTRDYFHHRILIFRDTLLRDFGHDPELLRAQVTRTVRHEIAHHFGWDENGVRKLGL